AERPHAEGHHVHRSAAHTAVEQIQQRGLHLLRSHPVVGRAGIGLADAADEGAVLNACHVAWVRASQEAVSPSRLVQPAEGAGLHQQLAQLVVLLLRAIAPVNAVGLAERGQGLVLPTMLAQLELAGYDRSFDLIERCAPRDQRWEAFDSAPALMPSADWQE